MRNGTYLANKESTVRVAGGAFSFRNPPKFHSFIRPSIRDAEHETDALIDHLFWHKNHGPFLTRRLIQRLTTSNPSPRYVEAVNLAFRTGSHAGRTFSGQYGGLGTAFAAIVLDREARSTTLDADPTHGMLREPLLKMIHVMRSLEWGTGKGRMPDVRTMSTMGQQHVRAASPLCHQRSLLRVPRPCLHVVERAVNGSVRRTRARLSGRSCVLVCR